MKTNRLLNIIGGVLVAALFCVGGCQSLSEEEKAQARIREWNAFAREYNAKQQEEQNVKTREWNAFAREYNAKQQAPSQNNYQNSPQQNNLEKNAEKAITHGVGEFIGEALMYEYLKK